MASQSESGLVATHIEVVHLVLKRAEGGDWELRTVDSDIESLSPLQS